MFKFLKNIFSRRAKDAATSHARTAEQPVTAARSPDAFNGVEVASLSLRVVLEKLPSDLRAAVNQLPDEGMKIVLPVNTIMKQLPSGCVKMSLASLVRQAPVGTFRKTEMEEKRMIDVPLAEVFKAINVGVLRRRAQRDYEVPEDVNGLFGKNGRSHSVVPPEPPPSPKPEPLAAAQAPEELKLPPPITPPARTETPATPPKMPPLPPPTESRVTRIPTPVQQPSAAPLKLDGELTLSLVEIAAGWAEGIRCELSVLTGDTRVVIPVSEVSPGLQKGKVAFTWAKLKKCLVPHGPQSIAIPEDTVLVLPLKIVAPAFVAASGATRRESEAASVNEKLPDFFGPSAGRTSEPAAPAPAAAQPDPLPAPEVAHPPVALSMTTEPVPTTELVPAAEPAPTPAPIAEPLTLAELFSEAGTTDWSPARLVKLACELPGVLGTVVALGEGLVIAHKLPDGLSADTFAAFMPQIFSRLDKYTGEMQLGDTGDIQLTTAGGPCQLIRRGKVFVAFLGRTGEKLPAGLHLIATEISTQNS